MEEAQGSVSDTLVFESHLGHILILRLDAGVFLSLSLSFFNCMKPRNEGQVIGSQYCCEG